MDLLKTNDRTQRHQKQTNKTEDRSPSVAIEEFQDAFSEVSKDQWNVDGC